MAVYHEKREEFPRVPSSKSNFRNLKMKSIFFLSSLLSLTSADNLGLDWLPVRMENLYFNEHDISNACGHVIHGRHAFNAFKL